MADNVNVVETPKKQKFFTKDLVKCVVVLAAIALVASVLLGVMNYITYVDPDDAIKKEVGSFFGVDIESVAKDEARVINNYGSGEVISCFVAKDGDGNDIGYCYYTSGSGAKDGTIELLVYIDKEGVIKDIVAYDQGETAGYFEKVENANKSKYVGLDLDVIDGVNLFKKDNGALGDGDVLAYSGATKTSTGYHNAIAAAVVAYKNFN